MMHALLEVVTDPFGYSAIGCVCLALTGLCMMVVDVARGHAPRIWSTGLLLAGIAYAVANIGVFIVTISADPFAIFELAYIISVVFVGPALVMIALTFVVREYQRLGRLSILGFAAWIGCVGFAHLVVIAAVSASV